MKFTSTPVTICANPDCSTRLAPTQTNYCSRDCYDAVGARGKSGGPIPCARPDCDGEFEYNRNSSNKRYCSRECSSIMRGRANAARDHGTAEDRFWSKVDKSGECWEWTGATDRYGYGTFMPTQDQQVGTHRYSYMLANGEIPSTTHVLHTCDNPGCVNPAHLFTGDHQANVADMFAKGRQYRGPKAHVGQSVADAIRTRLESSNSTMSDVAAEFDVSLSTVKNIAARRVYSD